MREIVLPDNFVPGSPEAVAYIESQLPATTAEPVYDGSLSDPAPEPAAVVADARAALAPLIGYDLIVSGLETMLDGFKELRDA